MNVKNKLSLIVGFVFVLFSGFSQVGSPYSQYGVGDNSFRGDERSKAMGGIGLGLQSNNHLNNLNPASYSSFDSLSVIYAIGVNSGYNYIESSVDNVDRTDTRFGYFALGFKGNKYWSSSFGLAPMSRVDYTYKTSDENDENGQVDYYLHGSGGLNKVYWGNSFKINEDLSVGFNASYVFGPINKVTTIIFVDDWMNADNTKMDKQINASDVTLDFGAQYKFDLKNNSKLVLGAVFEPKTNMRSTQSILAGTVPRTSEMEDDYYKEIFRNENGDPELLTTAIDTSDIKGTVELPSGFGIGFTYSYKNKLVVGADFFNQGWSKIDNDFYNASYNNLMSFKGGLEYTPDFNNINHYYKRIKYRFGGHFTQTHLEVKGTQINDYGISFGAGFPLKNSKSAFNISCELGQRGTLEQNLLRETYAIISLNISLSDIWFVKRKFN